MYICFVSMLTISLAVLNLIDSIKFQLIVCKHGKFYTNLTSFVVLYIFTAIRKQLDGTKNFQAGTDWFLNECSKQSLV